MGDFPFKSWDSVPMVDFQASQLEGVRKHAEFMGLERERIAAASAGGKIQIVWTLNKAGNTGQGDYSSLQCAANNDRDSPTSSTQAQVVRNYATIRDWCSANGFVRWPTTLCDAFGLHLECYAAKNGREHVGKNNQLATYLCCDAQTGLAPRTVIGKAVFIRTNGCDGAPVSLALSELTRAMSFINDLMDVYGDGPEAINCRG